jgi:hypothetical protein
VPLAASQSSLKRLLDVDLITGSSDRADAAHCARGSIPLGRTAGPVPEHTMPLDSTAAPAMAQQPRSS